MSDTPPKIRTQTKKTEVGEQPVKKSVNRQPCWYMLNNFKCCNENCKFSHDEKFVNEHKQKREIELCREFKKCSTKCNKYHNVFEIMDLYKDISNKLETIKGIVKY